MSKLKLDRNAYHVQDSYDRNLWFNYWDSQGKHHGCSSCKRFKTRKAAEKFMKKIGGKFILQRWQHRLYPKSKLRHYVSEYTYTYPEKPIGDFYKKHIYIFPAEEE